MDIAISLEQGSADDLDSLREWLLAEDELRGCVRRSATTPADPGHMGPAIDALTVAVGSGGALSALAASIPLWLKSLRSDIHVVISDADGTRRVELDATNVTRGSELIATILRDVER